jgi:hypothetical protein
MHWQMVVDPSERDPNAPVIALVAWARIALVCTPFLLASIIACVAACVYVLRLLLRAVLDIAAGSKDEGCRCTSEADIFQDMLLHPLPFPAEIGDPSA